MKQLNFFKNFIYILIISLMFSTFLNVSAEDAPAMTSTSAYLVDVTGDFVLYEKAADEKRFPASTTKIMTALVVLENTQPSDLVTVTQEALDDVGDLRSPYNFRVGEIFTVEELLYVIMLNSSNDMSTALAIHVGGSIEGFVEMMNDKAQELGLENTNFMNAHGLHDENHYTTAEDLYKITVEALKQPLFREIVNTAQKEIPATNMTAESRLILTTNRLILRQSDPIYYDVVDGVKTGFTTPAGHCLVTLAEQDDTTLISVTLQAEYNDAESMPGSFPESKQLLQWGFSNFETKSMVSEGDVVTEVPVALSAERDKIVLVADSELSGIMPISADTEEIVKDIIVDEDIRAPITQGQKLGTMKVSYDGHVYGEVDIVALQDAPLSQVLYYVDLIENFFATDIFKIIIISLIAFVFIYIFTIILLRRRKKRILYSKRPHNTSRYTGKKK